MYSSTDRAVGSRAGAAVVVVVVAWGGLTPTTAGLAHLLLLPLLLLFMLLLSGIITTNTHNRAVPVGVTNSPEIPSGPGGHVNHETKCGGRGRARVHTPLTTFQLPLFVGARKWSDVVKGSSGPTNDPNYVGTTPIDNKYTNSRKFTIKGGS